jgi:hypothetical protein
VGCTVAPPFTFAAFDLAVEQGNHFDGG